MTPTCCMYMCTRCNTSLQCNDDVWPLSVIPNLSGGQGDGSAIKRIRMPSFNAKGEMFRPPLSHVAIPTVEMSQARETTVLEIPYPFHLDFFPLHRSYNHSTPPCPSSKPSTAAEMGEAKPLTAFQQSYHWRVSSTAFHN